MRHCHFFVVFFFESWSSDTFEVRLLRSGLGALFQEASGSVVASRPNTHDSGLFAKSVFSFEGILVGQALLSPLARCSCINLLSARLTCMLPTGSF